MPTHLLTLIDAAIRSAEDRHRSTVRASEIALARTILELGELRDIVVLAPPAREGDADWLDLSEIARHRPAGASTSPEAVAKAIRRHSAKAPVATMKRRGATVWPRHWLENEGIIERVSETGHV